MFFSRKNSASADITPQELRERMQRGEPISVVDVREPSEHQEARIAGSTLIPLGQLAFHMDTLPSDRPIVVMCHSGNRSAVAAGMLKRAGRQVINLRGGISAWARAGLPVERS